MVETHFSSGGYYSCFRSGFFKCFREPIRVPRIEKRVPRIREIDHRVPIFRENRVPRTKEIVSLLVHTGYLIFSLKKLR